jgi:hypothetical protein
MRMRCAPRSKRNLCRNYQKGVYWTVFLGKGGYRHMVQNCGIPIDPLALTLCLVYVFSLKTTQESFVIMIYIVESQCRI